MGHAAVGADHKTVEHIAPVEAWRRPFRRLAGGGQQRRLAASLEAALTWAGLARLELWDTDPQRPRGQWLRHRNRLHGGLGLHLHQHRLTGQLGGHLADHRQVVLAQPTAGEAVGRQQLQTAVLKRGATGRTDPGFEGGLAEIRLESLLNLVPQLLTLLHRSLTTEGRI